ncbi:aldehyde ferredoxin oxidoreductase family protein [bacterium]|nr:aldehyde ferredoxin oxidoreductase family protein [bacterium]
MPFGYHGKILRIDLSSSKITVEKPSEAFFRTYMGGSALNLYYLLNEMPVGVDPLGIENILAISTGVTTGAPISGLSRLTVSAKSPLTGAIGDSQCGGSFPVKLKFAGFDAVFVKGKASSPVYLLIDNGKAELKDASHLWGKVTGDVETALQEELGDKEIEVFQIGPAGEKQVLFASIMTKSNRAAGRTGMGAVMGSKNLKAIVVRGNIKPKPADKKSLLELARRGAKDLPDSGVAYLGKYGTAGIVAPQNAGGGLPSFNYKGGSFKGADKIDGVSLYENMLQGHEEGKQDSEGRDGCFACVIRCKRVVSIKNGPFPVNPRYGGPEYQTISSFGSLCGIDDLAAISKANEICNRYGVDTISCGSTIAWAMDAFNAGILTVEQTDGLEIRFGDAEMMVKLTEMICKREGFGRLLSEGSAKAAERLGQGKELLITSKGQEAPAHMPHVKRSLALIYAVNPFGADHESSEHDSTYEEQSYKNYEKRYKSMGLKNPQPTRNLGPEKVEYARKTQYLFSLMDSLNLCQFAWGPSWQLYGPADMVTMIQAITGWDVTVEELLEVGERRLNMMRSFNAKEGFDRNHDRLPEKFFKALKNGPTNGWKVDRIELESALNEYYRQCGWNEETGNPTPETLHRLGLSWILTANINK